LEREGVVIDIPAKWAINLPMDSIEEVAAFDEKLRSGVRTESAGNQSICRLEMVRIIKTFSQYSLYSKEYVAIIEIVRKMNEESVYNTIFYLQSHIQLKYFRIRLKALCSKPSADMFVRSAYAALFSVRLQFFHNLYRVRDLLKFILIVVQFSKINRYFILMPPVNSYEFNKFIIFAV
jgi:hypothetical protein